MRLLREMGYDNVRYYRGGLENWTQHGLTLATDERVVALTLGAPGDRARADRSAEPARVRRSRTDRLADVLDALPVRRVFEIWISVILGFGLLYWVEGSFGARALQASDHVAGGGWRGLGEALYFSFVTALSIGYGDVVPAGVTRVLAIVEGTGGLILFGVLITKLVSRRQEAITNDIHRIAFEDRLGRVRTNLHLVLTELQAIALQADGERGADGPGAATGGGAGRGAAGPRRFASRLESAAAVFAGELRTVHDLLYRPERNPEEEVLAAILASLAAVLEEMGELLDLLAAGARSDALDVHLRSVGRLADEICGECVPLAYAPELKDWMDRIRTLSRRVTPA